MLCRTSVKGGHICMTHFSFTRAFEVQTLQQSTHKQCHFRTTVLQDQISNYSGMLTILAWKYSKNIRWH